jgi:hypothetical protein
MAADIPRNLISLLRHERHFLIDAIVLKCLNLATFWDDRYFYIISVLHAVYETQTSASIYSPRIPY